MIFHNRNATAHFMHAMQPKTKARIRQEGHRKITMVARGKILLLGVGLLIPFWPQISSG